MQSWARNNFLAFRQRQGDNVIELGGHENIQQMIRYRCPNGHGVATTNIDITQKPTILWPEKHGHFVEQAVLSRAQLCSFLNVH